MFNKLFNGRTLHYYAEQGNLQEFRAKIDGGADLEGKNKVVP
jgi:hypothetical protein